MLARLLVLLLVFWGGASGAVAQGLSTESRPRGARWIEPTRNDPPGHWIKPTRNDPPGHWIEPTRNDPPGRHILDGFGKPVRLIDY